MPVWNKSEICTTATYFSMSVKNARESDRPSGRMGDRKMGIGILMTKKPFLSESDSHFGEIIDTFARSVYYLDAIPIYCKTNHSRATFLSLFRTKRTSPLQFWLTRTLSTMACHLRRWDKAYIAITVLLGQYSRTVVCKYAPSLKWSSTLFHTPHAAQTRWHRSRRNRVSRNRLFWAQPIGPASDRPVHIISIHIKKELYFV